VESGREVLILHEDTQTPAAATFSSDASSIAIVFAEGDVRVLESFPLDERDLPGDELLPVADRFEMWKRMRRTGRDITPEDVHPDYGEALVLSDMMGKATEDVGP
jgi:hypothetical protein